MRRVNDLLSFCMHANPARNEPTCDSFAKDGITDLLARDLTRKLGASKCLCIDLDAGIGLTWSDVVNLPHDSTSWFQRFDMVQAAVLDDQSGCRRHRRQ
jgi:hypothetical protein